MTPERLTAYVVAQRLENAIPQGTRYASEAERLRTFRQFARYSEQVPLNRLRIDLQFYLGPRYYRRMGETWRKLIEATDRYLNDAEAILADPERFNALLVELKLTLPND